MARDFKRYLSNFTCQDSAAISPDADSSGTKTLVNTASAGNADGCDEAFIEVDVTVAPTVAARCEVYHEPTEQDGAGFAKPIRIGLVDIPTSTGKYVVDVQGLHKSGNIYLRAIDAGFTASANCLPYYRADT